MNWYTLLFKSGEIVTAFGASLEDALASIGRKTSDVRRATVDRHEGIDHAAASEHFAALAAAKAGAS